MEQPVTFTRGQLVDALTNLTAAPAADPAAAADAILKALARLAA